MRTLQPVTRVALLALLVSTVACGDSRTTSTSTSPAAPSTGSTSATLSTGNTGSATANVVITDRHKSGKAVEIEGLITSITDGTLVVNGTMINVPADAVVRHGNQRLTFTDLKVGQRVEVRGTPGESIVIASEVKLKDESRDDDDDANEAEVEGAVGALAGSCPSLTFTVNAAAVSTDAATRFKEGTCSQVTNGVRVEVKGVRQSNGSINATRVELDEDDEAEVEGAVGALAGNCPSLTFTVNATTVSTDAATRFKDGTCSQVTSGVRVEVKGVRQSNGSINATRVELDEDND